LQIFGTSPRMTTESFAAYVEALEIRQFGDPQIL
jgi:hypothetical protein